MQYSMNDHKNQPIIKRTGKKYLWIGIEKPGNTHMLSYRWLKQKCGHTNENENTSDCGTNTGVCELPEVRASLVVPCARVV